MRQIAKVNEQIAELLARNTTAEILNGKVKLDVACLSWKEGLRLADRLMRLIDGLVVKGNLLDYLRILRLAVDVFGVGDRVDFSGLDVNDYFAVAVAELERVVEQVNHHLQEAQFVPVNHLVVGLLVGGHYGKHYLQVFDAYFVRDHSQRLVDHVEDTKVLIVQFKRVALQLGKVQQVAHQVLHDLRRVVHGVYMILQAVYPLEAIVDEAVEGFRLQHGVF